MRKGFTRKPQRDEPATPVKNYITRSGLERLKDEHRFLLTRERPAVTEVVAWAAGNGDRSENADYQYGKRRLRQIDGRIRFLTKRIDAAEVVDPESPRAGQAATRAFFGATVRVLGVLQSQLRREPRNDLITSRPRAPSIWFSVPHLRAIRPAGGAMRQKCSWSAGVGCWAR